MNKTTESGRKNGVSRISRQVFSRNYPLNLLRHTKIKKKIFELKIAKWLLYALGTFCQADFRVLKGRVNGWRMAVSRRGGGERCRRTEKVLVFTGKLVYIISKWFLVS